MRELQHPARCALGALCLLGSPCGAADYFVAPDGDDANPGSQAKPFATVQRAQREAAPGDTIFLRGGTYRMREEQIAKRHKIWAYVTCLDKSGTPDKPIRCWAFCNGFSPEFKSLADGNGFKAGGYGSTPADRLPATIPRHAVLNCLAARNKASGFYANHHPAGCDWLANQAYRNTINFNLLGRLADNRTDVPGRGHVLRSNFAFKGRADIGNIDTNACDLSDNQFGADRVWKESDFQTTDVAALASPRGADGALPEVGFLTPKRPCHGAPQK